MEILCFKIKGKLAHFRKYYANNTAFSFTIPPRTTLMGIVAASIGWSRDSYYKKLSSENIRFGIRVLAPLKKSFHRLNLLSIKSTGDLSKKWSSDFRGEGGRIQTPFEIVSGLYISSDDVKYQVFIKAEPSGINTFNELINHFRELKQVFSVTLGTANFTANIYDVEIINKESLNYLKEEDFLLIHSAIPIQIVKELQFEKEEYGNYNFVEEDMMPGDFIEDNNREVRKMNRLLFSVTQNPLRVKLNNGYYKVKLNDETINIQFMDL